EKSLDVMLDNLTLGDNNLYGDFSNKEFSTIFKNNMESAKNVSQPLFINNQNNHNYFVNNFGHSINTEEKFGNVSNTNNSLYHTGADFEGQVPYKNNFHNFNNLNTLNTLNNFSDSYSFIPNRNVNIGS